MNVGFSNTLSDLRFDVLVQAKEVLRVVLLLDSHEPVVVGTERGFDRVFSLLTQVIQEVRTARERTHRIRQTASPFDMALRLSWLQPLCKDENVILGLPLRKSSIGDTNPTRNSTIVLDNHRAEWRCRPVRMLHKVDNRVIAQLTQECRFPVVMVTVREARVQKGLHLREGPRLNLRSRWRWPREAFYQRSQYQTIDRCHKSDSIS